MIDQIEITKQGFLQIREEVIEYIDIIKDENGNDIILEEDQEYQKQETNRYYHRYVLSPGDSLIGQPQEVIDAANQAWAPEVIEAYQLEIAKLSPLYGKTEAEIIEINKQAQLNQISLAQLSAQEQGFTCSNGIKLQTREEDLIRWTQLTTTLLAFQPETVTIRDFDNVNHVLTTSTALQMMGEIAAWGQSALQATWEAKDAILNLE